MGKTDMAEDASGAEDGAGRGPDRRGNAGVACGGGGKLQLRLQHARLALLALRNGTEDRHAGTRFPQQPIIASGLLIITDILVFWAHALLARFSALRKSKTGPW